MNELLIVFCKNPILGKVKTRLAKKVGDNKALEIYKVLLSNALKVARGSSRDFAVYFHDHIDSNDFWRGARYKQVQKGADIGERMDNAINDGLQKGYDSIVLIGADVYGLTSKIVDEAFEHLISNDVVIGPARDGGYYLIGMKAHNSKIFTLSEWSTPRVLKETLLLVKQEKATYHLVDELNDIDDIHDLKETELFKLL